MASVEINPPIKFAQPSESTPAKTIIVHIPKMEVFISSLNPAAFLYEDVTDEEDIKLCFKELGEYLKTKNIRMITVEEALFIKGKEEELKQLAEESLIYQKELEYTKKEEKNEEQRERKELSKNDFIKYSSDNYRKNVLQKFSKNNLMKVILTRPSLKLNILKQILI